MTDTTVEEAEEPAKPSKLPLIIGVVLALAGGGGGFFAVQSGMLGSSGDGGDGAHDSHADEAQASPDAPLPDVAFIEVPPLLISLGPNAQANHLRFRASLEVGAESSADVEGILPRIQDVLNSYLRALEPMDLEAQGALVRLRAQMLRRVQMVAGEGRVRDLLVLEFVLN